MATPDQPAQADPRIEEIRWRLADNPDSEGGAVRDVEWVARQCKIAELAQHLLTAYDQAQAHADNWFVDRERLASMLTAAQHEAATHKAAAAALAEEIGPLRKAWQEGLCGEWDVLREANAGLTAERDRLAAQVQQARALHQQGVYAGVGGDCIECTSAGWPCPTLAALGEPSTPDQPEAGS